MKVVLGCPRQDSNERGDKATPGLWFSLRATSSGWPSGEVPLAQQCGSWGELLENIDRVSDSEPGEDSWPPMPIHTGCLGHENGDG